MTVGLLSSIAPPPLGLHSVVRRGNILADMGAVFAIDAEFSVPGEQWVMNRASDQRLRAKYGSVARAEIRKAHGLVLPRGTTDMASTPDAATLDLTSTAEIVVRMSCDDPSIVGSQVLVAKKNGNSSEYSFDFEIYAGTLYIIWTTGGTTATQAYAQAAPPGMLPGVTYWVRATIAPGVGKVFWAPDQETEPSVWTDLGAPTTGAGGSIYSGSAPLCIGNQGSGSGGFGGIIKRAIVRTAPGGATVFDTGDIGSQAELTPSYTASHGYGVKDGAIVTTGAFGPSVTVPDSAALDITGDLEVVLRTSMFDWTQPNNVCPIGKAGASTTSWYLNILSDARVRLYHSSDGTALKTHLTSNVISAADGATIWLKVVLDVDNGASGSTAYFYTAPDQDAEPSSWTLLQSITNAGTTSIYSGADPITIGHRGDLQWPFPGSVKRAIVRNGIGGTTVLDVNPATVANDAQTFTAGHGYGVKAGAFIAVAPGQILSTPDSAAIEASTQLELIARLALRKWNATTWNSIIAKWNGGADRAYHLGIPGGDSGKLYLQLTTDGTTVQQIGSTVGLPAIGAVDGQYMWIKATWRSSDGRVQFWWAPDAEAEPTAWTQLGTDRSLLSGATLWGSGTAPLWVGANTSTVNDPLFGRVKRAIMRRSIGGADAINIDLAGVADDAQSFVCTTGQTVTISGCARPTATVNGCALPTVTVTAANAVDTNDPKLATWTGTSYAAFPDTAAGTPNYVSTPAVAYNTTGDVEFIVQTTGINWSDTTRRSICGSWPGAGGLLVDRFNGTQFLVGCSNSANNCYATPPHGLTGVADQWFRLRYIKSTGTWAVAKSADGISWTDITSATNTPSPGVDFPNFAQPVTIGGSVSLGSINGSVPFVEMRNGIAGTALFRYRETDNSANSRTGWTSSTGEIWTINRATSGRKVAWTTRPVWLLGTDDYLEVADNDLLDFDGTQSLTVLVVGRAFGTQAGNARFISKRATTGYVINRVPTLQNRDFSVNDGAWKSAVLTGVDGELQVLAMVRDISSGVVRGYLDQQTATYADASPASLASSTPLRIGGEGGGSLFIDAEIYAAAVFRRALSAAEIDAVVAHYGSVAA